MSSSSVYAPGENSLESDGNCTVNTFSLKGGSVCTDSAGIGVGLSFCAPISNSGELLAGRVVETGGGNDSADGFGGHAVLPGALLRCGTDFVGNVSVIKDGTNPDLNKMMPVTLSINISIPR